MITAPATELLDVLGRASGLSRDEVRARLGLTNRMILHALQNPDPAPERPTVGRPQREFVPAQVIGALRSEGSVRGAARCLDISHRTLQRWIDRTPGFPWCPWGLGLTRRHYQLLRSAGITREVAEARGYRSLSQGLKIPLWGIGDERSSAQQLRLDDPKDKSKRYRGASRATVDVSPLGRAAALDPKRALYIAESVRGGDAAVSRGLACVAIQGVRRIVFEPEAWAPFASHGRAVIVAFDADAASNPEVSNAEIRLVDVLAALGARVGVLRLPNPGDKTGLDDFLGGGGEIESLPVTWVNERAVKF